MTVQYFLELIGTFVFAISGALAVKGKGHDWLAAGITGFITAIGGGTLRDLLLDRHPLVWMEDTLIIYVVIASIVFTYFFSETLARLRRTLLLFDTLGIAVFTVVGTEIALAEGMHPIVAAAMGMISAVMGSVIRDTLTNNTPVILKRDMYASTCLIGAAMYIGLHTFIEFRDLNAVLSACVIAALRLLAENYHWKFPSFDKESESLN